MAMTRKHFNEVANILAYYRKHADNMSPDDMVHNMTIDLCGFFKRDNPSFDRERFIEATKADPKPY